MGLKFQVRKLQDIIDQSRNDKTELLRKHASLFSQRDQYINHMKKEKENTMRLLKVRNENELTLQNEILEKNQLIKNLTKKLKESTQIIVSLNQKTNNVKKECQ